MDDPDDMDYEPSYGTTRSHYSEPTTREVGKSAERLHTPATPLQRSEPASKSTRRNGKRPGGRAKRLSLAKLPTPEWEKSDWDPDEYAKARVGTSGGTRRRGTAHPSSTRARNPGTASAKRDQRGLPRKSAVGNQATEEDSATSSSAESELQETIRMKKRKQVDHNHERLMRKIFPERRK